MRFTALASSVLFAVVGLVSAVDNRLLYQFPAGDTLETFSADFEAACSTWQPAIDQGLTYARTLIEPGDWQGKNADTQAKIICSWTDGTNFPPFTVDVAASLGATPL
ncbi:glycoside hydrolase family 81 protein [Favolaschia claudopus]|uniref:Glycoside hydrolase family 81 protein n=1 Tax=Favolaschia claudopus TaxID=2862362 RepID=A0AAW0E314_9AGAR